jgi:sulfur dioxygenase
MIFRQLFDADTSTYSYLLGDEASREALLIDPVREHVERDLELVTELGLRLVWVLETHVHADHVTGAGSLRERGGARAAVSRRGGAPCADRQLDHGDRIALGDRHLEVRATPGHTDSCVTYVLDDRTLAFTGDTLLIRGCGRTDFQEGDPRRLWRSVHEQIFTLPDHCRLYPAHDYRGHTVTTVAEEKRHNPRLGEARTEQEFVAIMRGLGLAPPTRIAEAVPANRNCGLGR